MGRLSRKLTAGLVGIDVDADETLDVILQLLERLLSDADSRLVIDPSFEDGHCCSREKNCLLEHLWAVLINWTVRAGDGSTTKNRIFACLTQLMHSCQQSFPPAQFALLAAQPWNYTVVVDAIRCPSGPSNEALKLATTLIHHSKTMLKCGISFSEIYEKWRIFFNLLLPVCCLGAHPWSVQLEETLSRHAH